MFEFKTERGSDIKREDLQSDELFTDIIIKTEIEDVPEYVQIYQNVDNLDINIKALSLTTRADCSGSSPACATSHPLGPGRIHSKGNVQKKVFFAEENQNGNSGKDNLDKQMIIRKKFSSLKLALEKSRNCECKHCGLVFQSSSSLLQHCCTEVRFQCKLCLETFDRESALKIHQAYHGTRRKYTCHVCLKAFTRRGTLKDHFLSHKGKKPFQCEVCKKYYRSKVALASHIRQHYKAKEYVCGVCKKMFIMPSALRLHEKSHKKVKEYRCSICEKHFTYRSSLFRHKREHFHEQQHPCDKCSKKFKHKWTLRHHQRTKHEGLKLLKCEDCGKTFTRARALKVHTESHRKLNRTTLVINTDQ